MLDNRNTYVDRRRTGQNGGKREWEMEAEYDADIQPQSQGSISRVPEPAEIDKFRASGKRAFRPLLAHAYTMNLASAGEVYKFACTVMQGGYCQDGCAGNRKYRVSSRQPDRVGVEEGIKRILPQG